MINESMHGCQEHGKLAGHTLISCRILSPLSLYLSSLLHVFMLAQSCMATNMLAKLNRSDTTMLPTLFSACIRSLLRTLQDPL
jgi:hypothetical protein